MISVIGEAPRLNSRGFFLFVRPPWSGIPPECPPIPAFTGGAFWVRGKRAFSLLELLVATSVLSIGIVVTLQAFSACAKAAAISLDTTYALFLAEDKMQEWEFNEKESLVAQMPATSEGIVGKFKWLYEMQPSGDIESQRMGFKVTWERLSRTEEIGFDTYLRQ